MRRQRASDLRLQLRNGRMEEEAPADLSAWPVNVRLLLESMHAKWQRFCLSYHERCKTEPEEEARVNAALDAGWSADDAQRKGSEILLQSKVRQTLAAMRQAAAAPVALNAGLPPDHPSTEASDDPANEAPPSREAVIAEAATALRSIMRAAPKMDPANLRGADVVKAAEMYARLFGLNMDPPPAPPKKADGEGDPEEVAAALDAELEEVRRGT